MLRNKQEEKRKALRKIYERYRELEYRPVDYFPVEKPYFMGWDISIALSESGKRRRDAPELQAVLDTLGATEKHFTRGVGYVRYIRRWRYSVDNIESAMVMDYKKGRNSRPYWFRPLSNYAISKSTYSNLPVAIQKYFYYDNPDYYSWGKYGDCYRLRFPFPTYELIYKVEKAYAHFQGIPRGKEWSEYERLSNILNNNNYWCAKNGFSRRWEKRESHYMNIKQRRAWKTFCSIMKNTDLSDESEEDVRKHLKNDKYK